VVDIEQIKQDIVTKLSPLNPEKIILFGSYANGNAHKDSDIDLYVVTNDDFIPQSWREKNKIYSKVISNIRDIVQQYPTDLIVHTKKMHDKFLAINHSFANEINAKGIKLL